MPPARHVQRQPRAARSVVGRGQDRERQFLCRVGVAAREGRPEKVVLDHDLRPFLAVEDEAHVAGVADARADHAEFAAAIDGNPFLVRAIDLTVGQADADHAVEPHALDAILGLDAEQANPSDIGIVNGPNAAARVPDPHVRNGAVADIRSARGEGDAVSRLGQPFDFQIADDAGAVGHHEADVVQARGLAVAGDGLAIAGGGQDDLAAPGIVKPAGEVHQQPARGGGGLSDPRSHDRLIVGPCRGDGRPGQAAEVLRRHAAAKGAPA